MLVHLLSLLVCAVCITLECSTFAKIWRKDGVFGKPDLCRGYCAAVVTLYVLSNLYSIEAAVFYFFVGFMCSTYILRLKGFCGLKY
jgi:hypothetical protein